MPYKDKAKRHEVKARWIEKNREKQREYNRKFHANNPEYTVERRRKRRALQNGSETSSYTAELVLERYGTTCHLCGDEIDLLAPRSTRFPGWETGLHVDHVLPIAKGGADTIANVRPSHGLCNIRKGGNSAEGT